MPFVKGQPRPLNVGRKKGSKNKVLSALAKGQPKTGVRKKGTKNKTLAEVSAMRAEIMTKALADDVLPMLALSKRITRI